MAGPRSRDGTPPDGIRRAGGAGRRNPDIADRIARGEPVLDQVDEPEGQVVRRTDEQDADQAAYSAADEQSESLLFEGDFLVPGDVIEAKVHHVIEFDDQPSNFSYQITTRLLEGETEPEAFGRVSNIVNGRVLDLAADAYEHVMEMKNQALEARRERDNAERDQRSGRTLRS